MKVRYIINLILILLIVSTSVFAQDIPSSSEFSSYKNEILSQETLTFSDIQAEFEINPRMKDLYDYAGELGYTFPNTMARLHMFDGSIITNIFLKSEEEGFILLTQKEFKDYKDSILLKLEGSGISFFDRDGGTILDENGINGYSTHQSCSTALCTAKCAAYSGWGDNEMSSFLRDIVDNLAGPCSGCSQNAKMCAAVCAAGAGSCVTVVACVPAMSACVGCVGITCGECMLNAGLNVWDGLAKVNTCRKECSANPSAYPGYPGWHCDPAKNEKKTSCNGDTYVKLGCDNCDWVPEYELDCSTLKDSNGNPKSCDFSYKNGKIDYMCVEKCESDADCDDHNDCTFDSCNLGGCSHRSKTCPQPSDRCSIAYCENEVGCVTKPNPGCDHPDDTYSVYVSEGTVETPIMNTLEETTPAFAYEFEDKVAVLFEGFPESTEKLLNHIGQNFTFVELDVTNEQLRNYPLLIIPSGGLQGLSDSKSFKDKLETYLNNGGIILSFAQQKGYEYGALPGGLEGYGWLEDQSCQFNSVYLDTYHPILASIQKVTPSVNVDGYFTNLPEDTTVLLRRTKNSMPSLVMYKYGAGTVIASTSYTDWVFGQGATPEGINFVKDMITWAKHPSAEVIEMGSGWKINLPNNISTMPSMPLSDRIFEGGDSVTIKVNVTNDLNGTTNAGKTANKIVFELTNPDFETSYSSLDLTLAHWETKEVEFSLSTDENFSLGPYYVLYSLYAGEEYLTGGFVGGFSIVEDKVNTIKYYANYVLTDPDGIEYKKNMTLELLPGQSGIINYTSDTISKSGLWSLDYIIYSDNHSKSGIVDYGSKLYSLSLYASNPSGWAYTGSGISFGVNSDTEKYYYGSNATFTFSIWNNYDVDKEVTVWWSFPHNYWATNNMIYGKPGTTSPGHSSNLVKTLTVPANNYTTFNYTIPVYSYDRFWSDVYLGGTDSWTSLGKATRGFYAIEPSVEAKTKLEKDSFEKEEPIFVNTTFSSDQNISLEVSAETYVRDYANRKLNSEIYNFSIENMDGTYSLTLPGLKSGDYMLVTEVHNMPSIRGRVIGYSTVPFSVPRDYKLDFYYDHENGVYSIYDKIDAYAEFTNVISKKIDFDYRAEIPELGVNNSFHISLNPGETKKVKVIDNVNLSILSIGIHKMKLYLDDEAYPVDKSFSIPNSKLELSLDNQYYNSSDNITVTIKNTGGVKTNYNLTLLKGYALDTMYGNAIGELYPGQSKQLKIPIPSHFNTGGYLLYMKYIDSNYGYAYSFYKTVSVTGARLEMFPEKSKYDVGEDFILVLNNPSSVPVNCNSLHNYYSYQSFPTLTNVSVPGRSEVKVNLGPMPYNTPSGQYMLWSSCIDSNLKSRFDSNKQINISGMDLSLSLSKNNYNVEEKIGLTINNVGPANAICSPTTLRKDYWYIWGNDESEAVPKGVSKTLYFNIPASTPSGEYSLYASCYETNSGKYFGGQFTVAITGSKVTPNIISNQLLSGDDITVNLKNEGGIDSALTCTGYIDDIKLDTVSGINLVKGESQGILFNIPRSYSTGDYSFSLSCSDSISGSRSTLDEDISVQGFNVSIELLTDSVFDLDSTFDITYSNYGIDSYLNCTTYINNGIIGTNNKEIFKGEDASLSVAIPDTYDSSDYEFKHVCVDTDAGKTTELIKTVTLLGTELDISVSTDTAVTGDTIQINTINNGGLDADCTFTTSLTSVSGSSATNNVLILKGGYSNFGYTIEPGLSEGTYGLLTSCYEHNSKKTIDIYQNITIMGFGFDITLDSSVYNAGDTVSVRVDNTGEINATCEYIRLKDGDRVIKEESLNDLIMPGEYSDFSIDLDDSLESNAYKIVVGCEDMQLNELREKSSVIDVTGAEVTLESDSDSYGADSSMVATVLNVGGIDISGNYRLYLSKSGIETDLDLGSTDIAVGDSFDIITTVPVSIDSGDYKLKIEYADTNSGRTITDEKDVSILGMQLDIKSIENVQAGILQLSLENTGAITDDLICSINIKDKEKVMPFSDSKSLSLSVGGIGSIQYSVPSDIVSGKYNAEITCDEQNSGKSVSKTFTVVIDSSSVELSFVFDKDKYLTGENIIPSLNADIHDIASIQNANVHTETYKLISEGGAESWDFVNVTEGCGYFNTYMGLSLDEDKAWFGMQTGLCMYDMTAKEFTQYDLSSEGTFSVSNMISDGEYVWISSYGGLLRFNKGDATLENLGKPEAVFEFWAQDMQIDLDGNLWIAMPVWEEGQDQESSKLFVIDAVSKQWSKFDFAANGIDATGINAFSFDGDDIWMVASDKMIKFDTDTQEVVEFALPFEFHMGQIAVTDSNVWMLSSWGDFSGIIKLNKETGELTNYTTENSELVRSGINSITAAGNKLWIVYSREWIGNIDVPPYNVYEYYGASTLSETDGSWTHYDSAEDDSISSIGIISASYENSPSEVVLLLNDIGADIISLGEGVVKEIVSSTDSLQTIYEGMNPLDGVSFSEDGLFEIESLVRTAKGQIIGTTTGTVSIENKAITYQFSTNKDVYKPGEDINISLEIYNNATITDSNVPVLIDIDGITAVSKTVEVLSENILYDNEIISHDSSFTLGYSVSGVSGTKVIEIENASLSYSLDTPEYVNSESFSAGLSITNDGRVDAEVDVVFYILGVEDPLTVPAIHAVIPLNSTYVVSRNMNTLENITINVAVSGDDENLLSGDVEFSEITGITLTETNFIRPGETEIPYTISNLGKTDSSVNATFTMLGKNYNAYFLVPEGQVMERMLVLNLSSGVNTLHYSNTLGETANFSIGVGDPVFEITGYDANKTFVVGQNATILMKIKNTGGITGKAEPKVNLPGLVEEVKTEYLNPGEEKELEFNFTIPDDLEEGQYNLIYALGNSKIRTKASIKGADISVEAKLDKVVYISNETARLNITIKNNNEIGLGLYAKVQYKLDEFENVSFALPGYGEISVSFDVPISEMYSNKVNYFIYQASGRSVYINYVNVNHNSHGEIYVSTDKGAYNIGDNIEITIDANHAGDIKFYFLGNNYSNPTLPAGKTIIDDTIPELISGTYDIVYNHTFDGNISIAETLPVDVMGYHARVIDFTADKDSYSEWDDMGLELLIESNVNISGTLKTTILDINGNELESSDSLFTLTEGENTLTVSKKITAGMYGLNRLSIEMIVSLSGNNNARLVYASKFFDVSGNLDDEVAEIINGFVGVTDSSVMFNLTDKNNGEYVLTIYGEDGTSNRYTRTERLALINGVLSSPHIITEKKDLSYDGSGTLINVSEFDLLLNVSLTEGYTTGITFKNASKANGNVGMLETGKFVEIDAPEISGLLNGTTIKMYYDQADIDSQGIDEDTLRLWYFNENTSLWIQYDTPYGGVNNEEDYVWAITDHFSVWGIFGSAIVVAPPPAANSATGGGSGGGGFIARPNATNNCTPDWQCIDWSACDSKGKQSRTCTEVNNCGDTSSIPELSRDCDVYNDETVSNEGDDILNEEDISALGENGEDTASDGSLLTGQAISDEDYPLNKFALGAIIAISIILIISGIFFVRRGRAK